jgi:phytanoyl-CoA hydroxylase
MISCYNRASNIGYNDSASGNSSVTPIEVVPDEMFEKAEATGLSEESSAFLAKEADVALK